MANQRKLLSEIDRTLKKVSEGVDVFNDIWDKVYAATAQNQKEKHESDLKKEIKKLQRFRDQIKNWIGNSDVKDKKPLMEARKLIEQKMEEFKVCEKETKTKAYSKEGLAQVERLDPTERAKQNSRMWLQDFLFQLNSQIEAFECDLERLYQGKGKNKNKHEIELLESTVSRHKWHVLKLEQVTRLLDNDALDSSKVDELKEDIEYYLEANQDPDYISTYGEDDIYEVLDLDALGASMQVVLPSEQDIGIDEFAAVIAEVAPTPIAIPEKITRSKTPKKSSSNSLVMGIGRAIPAKSVEVKSQHQATTPRKIVSSKSEDAIETKKIEEKKIRGIATRAKPLPSDSSKVILDTTPASIYTSSIPLEEATTATIHLSDSSQPPKGSAFSQNPIDGTKQFKTLQAHPTIHQMTEEQRQILNLTEQSFLFKPDCRDSESSSRYTPRNSYASSEAFPSTPLTLFRQPVSYEKLELDTLFFIFYHQQGCLQQYLAAKELKKRAWGYHKKYRTWFKRHEEPQVAQEDFEQGSFIYFDYESGWCQRMKTDFTFEYSFLEDELV
uniref:Subunit of the CCR4NOT complex putative n=1 Tax=Albugo laibachii Nc14 TaxID=890382 RepID=F0WAC8_9STRA|nr:Subunit of the CCR4NOT complex putative [Albugo laibachii Nc14]|eukprot:CCA18099.1 Subunit of the CCR4NOT complex putative [Albugo laibachii Nc14]